MVNETIYSLWKNYQFYSYKESGKIQICAKVIIVNKRVQETEMVEFREKSDKSAENIAHCDNSLEILVNGSRNEVQNSMQLLESCLVNTK